MKTMLQMLLTIDELEDEMGRYTAYKDQEIIIAGSALLRAGDALRNFIRIRLPETAEAYREAGIAQICE